MRAHTGEKPYSSKECLKSWTQLSSLRNHTKTHTREKSFHCPS